MKLKLLVVVLPPILPAPLVAADLLVWEHQAVSQRDIDAYEWRCYLRGATKGIELKGVVYEEPQSSTSTPARQREPRGR